MRKSKERTVWKFQGGGTSAILRGDQLFCD
jgi:hypothetical protein